MFILLFLLFLQSPPASGVVERVVDGDTFVLASGDRVRMIGIDTPETVHPTRGVEPYGKQASDFSKSLLSGKRVRLVYDVQARDRYGRLLAYVYLADGTFVNAELVKRGYAQVSTYPPNVKHQDTFLALQREARSANRGLWAAAPAEVTPPRTPRQAGTVFVNGSSEVYHKAGCKHVTARSKEVRRLDLPNGARACRVCRP
jgi:endonuclease YncB( thermonuclease family)